MWVSTGKASAPNACAQDHLRGLGTHAGQRLKLLLGARHLAAVAFQQDIDRVRCSLLLIVHRTGILPTITPRFDGMEGSFGVIPDVNLPASDP